MKIGIVDMELNFVPGAEQNAQVGTARSEWEKTPKIERIEHVLSIINNARPDFIELGVPWINDSISPQAFDEVKEIISRLHVPIEAYCSLMPAHIKVTGPDVDTSKIRKYLELVFHRISELNGKIVVFGSGKSRNIPGGFAKEIAKRQLEVFLTIADEIINEHEYDFKLAIESLNTSESNIVNSLSEAFELVQNVNSKNIGLLLDIFHCTRQPESLFDDIAKFSDNIFHIHVSQPETRLWPGSRSDMPGSFDFERFFETLKANNYGNRVSVECIFKNISTEIRPTIEFLRKMTN